MRASVTLLLSGWEHASHLLIDIGTLYCQLYTLSYSLVQQGQVILVMITNLQTTVQTTWGQCVVAFLVALVEMLLRLNESVYAPLYALFLVGPAANLIEIWWHSRQSAPAAAPRLA